MEKYNMEKFNYRYENDPGFKEFVEISNLDEVLYDFGYNLYMAYGKKAPENVKYFVNPDVINIEVLIKYFENKSEFEKCNKLIQIKNH